MDYHWNDVGHKFVGHERRNFNGHHERFASLDDIGIYDFRYLRNDK